MIRNLIKNDPDCDQTGTYKTASLKSLLFYWVAQLNGLPFFFLFGPKSTYALYVKTFSSFFYRFIS